MRYEQSESESWQRGPEVTSSYDVVLGKVGRYNQRLEFATGQIPHRLRSLADRLKENAEFDSPMSLSDLRELYTFCIGVDSSFARHVQMPTQDIDAESARMFHDAMNCLLFIPRGKFHYAYLDANGQEQYTVGSLNLSSRGEHPHPFLQTVAYSMQSSDFQRNPIMIGDVAILSDARAQRSASVTLSNLDTIALYGFPLVLKCKEYMDKKKLREKFSTIEALRQKHEEIAHAHDLQTVEYCSGIPVLRQRRNLRTMQCLCKADSPVRKFVDFNKDHGGNDHVIAVALVELSGQVRGAIEAMKQLIQREQMDEAYALFLYFMALQETHAVAQFQGSESQYGLAATWLFMTHDPRSASNGVALVEQCEKGDSHPARHALALLEALDRKNCIRELSECNVQPRI